MAAPIVNAIFKLLEFEVINTFVTNNRQRDALVQTAILSVLVLFQSYIIGIGASVWNWSKTKWQERRGTMIRSLVDNGMDGFTNKDAEHIDTDTLVTFSWSISEHFRFTAKLIAYCYLYLPTFSRKSNILYNFETGKTRPLSSRNQWDKFQATLRERNTVVFRRDGGVVLLSADSECVAMRVTNTIIARQFYDFIMGLKIEFDESQPIGNVAPPQGLNHNENFLKIYQGDTVTDLSPYRNMEHFISRHKPIIVTALQTFPHRANKYNHFGSNNLGLLLYGPPGTGKTLLAKVICNELRRDCRWVDMSTIKTKKKFVALFEDDRYKKEVIVFDEFDCIGGVLKARRKDVVDDGDDDDDAVRILHAERNKLLLQIAETKDPKETEAPRKRLEDIKTELNELNNRLTLGTMLTVLDGMVEYDGRVMIACTNHPERIDPALIRPGRFDLCIRLDNFNDAEIRELLTKVFSGEWDNRPRASVEEWQLLAETKFADGIFSPSHINNVVLCQGTLRKTIEALQAETIERQKQQDV